MSAANAGRNGIGPPASMQEMPEFVSLIRQDVIFYFYKAQLTLNTFITSSPK